jgi:hypothetical protein
MRYHRVIINDELGGMLQEAIVAYFKGCQSFCLRGRNKKNEAIKMKEGKDTIIPQRKTDKSFEYSAKFKYFGMTISNCNYIHDELSRD